MCLLFSFLFLTKINFFKNYEKCLLSHLKSSFHSRDIRFFRFPSSLFSHVSHYLRRQLRINLKVYDFTTSEKLWNRNLWTHIVWYHEKQRRSDIKIWLIDQVLNKKNFYGENYAENVQQKLVPDPLILISSSKQQLLARNSFENKLFWKTSM